MLQLENYVSCFKTAESPSYIDKTYHQHLRPLKLGHRMQRNSLSLLMYSHPTNSLNPKTVYTSTVHGTQKQSGETGVTNTLLLIIACEPETTISNNCISQIYPELAQCSSGELTTGENIKSNYYFTYQLIHSGHLA